MKTRSVLFIVVLAASLALLVGPGVAAPPVQAPEPPNESSALSDGSSEGYPFDPAEAAFVSRNAVLAEGSVLVADNDYRRAEFTAEGVRFAPREEGEIVPGHSLTYRLAEIRSGHHVHFAPSENEASAAITPLVVENRVEYARPAGITERYVVGDDYVEQLFVLSEPLALDGNLEVAGQFETALTPELVDPFKGVRFLDGGVDVLHYSGATVFDATGRETPAPLSLDGGRVTITVPEEWLAEASYPVTIDPRLEGGLINVAYLTLDQDEPAVAYSTLSGQYLVVFESSSGSGNILGRFVDAQTGQVLSGSFYIADSSSREANPDVAYDPYRNRFLVVYEDGSAGSRNIVGILVYGAYQSSGSQLPTALPTMIAGAGADEYDPAVAYNSDNHQFAVVYLRSTYMVYGRMVGSYATYPNPLGSAGFEIRNYGSGATHAPDVAWGSGGNTFVVVWARERPSGDTDPDYIALGYLYDTYQGGGSQAQGSIWRMAPYDRGSDPLTYDCHSPAVAYDPVANAYVVVFNHMEGTSALSPSTIRGQRVRSQYNSSTFRYDSGYAFSIESNVAYNGHYYPDITYSGVGNEMHVAYMSWYAPGAQYWYIYNRTLHGTSVGSRLLVRYSGDDDGLEDPALAGSPGKGRSLVVWREEYTPSDWDIFGQRVSPYWVFLPTVLASY
jgi:hypothetical protein